MLTERRKNAERGNLTKSKTMDKSPSVIFFLSILFILLSSTTQISAFSSYSRAAPALTFANQNSAYRGGQIYPPIDQSMCQAGQDFIIQVDPLGCTPSVTRSDLLEQQDVTVFCPIVATQLNPLIKVNDISSMIITPSSIPKDVLTVGYFPAAAALGQLNPQITTQFLGNIGYAAIVLKRQPNESAMPNFVQGNLTARLIYNINNAAGTGRSVYYIPKLTDQEWNQNFAAYSFWNGRGYIRLLGADNKGATIGVYSGIDSSGNARTGEKTQIATLPLSPGETSSQVFLPGFDYCMGGLRLKLQDLENPDTMAKLRIDSDTLQLKETDQFLDGRCQVKNIVKQGINQNIDISCNEDQARSSFTLRINPQVNISLNGTSSEYSVGDKLYDEGIDSVYLGFVGNNGTTNSQNDLYIRLISIPKDKGGTETRLTDSEIAYMAGYDKGVAGSADSHAGILGIGSDIGKKIFSYLGQGVQWFMGKSLGYVHYSGAEGEILFGTSVRVVGYAGVFDADLSRMPKEVVNNYTNAMNDYETIKSSFAGEKDPVTGQASIGEEALYNAIDLADKLDQKRKALQLCQDFSENYNSLPPAICNDDYLLSNVQISDQSVLINGQTHTISFEGIREPGFDEFGLVINVVSSDGISTQYQMTKNEVIYLNDTTNEYIQLTNLDENSASLQTSLIGKTSLKGILQSAIKLPSQTLKKGTVDSLGSLSYSFSIQKINLQKVAKVSVEPQVDYARANSTFNFKIGIEKRNIKLSPAQTKDRIQSLNSTIQKLTKITDTLGKVVSVGKTACFVTEGYLTIKNFVANLGGTGIARQTVMRSDKGWYNKCNQEMKDNPGKYLSVESCLQAHSAEIDASVNAYDAPIQQRNHDIQQLKSGISNYNLFGENIVNTDALSGRVIDSGLKNKILTTTNGVFNNSQIKVGNQKVNISDIASVITVNTTTLSQLEDLQLNTGLLSSSDPTVAAIAKSQVEKTLGEIYSNSQTFVQRQTLSSKYGIPVIMGATRTLKEYPLTKANTFADVKDNFRGADIPDNTYVTIFVDQVNGNQYLLTMNNDFVINQTYTIKSGVLNATQETNPLGLSIKKVDSSTYQNRYLNPEIRYYEADPYKGLPEVVPFDLTNGWYAAVKSELPVFGGVRAYDASGRVSSFYLCNVGANGREENLGGDDNCAIFIPGANQAPVFQGLDPREAQVKMNQAVQAIRDATNAYRAGVTKVTINHQSINVGKPSSNIPDIQCEDFMSPSDCNILFNVCDPVVCPSSRCNLGGAYPVNDVIQSGIAGSIFLCLPNFPQVKVPICVSGVNAGLDAYNSVLKSYQQCLQTSLDTGQTVGICDELNSVYMCQFFWSQGIPVIKYAIPKIAGSVLGQPSTVGGGEYLAGSDALSNAQKSIDYFSQYYAANSYKAFKARSSQDVGDAVCKNFISYVSPQGGNLLNTLTAPDSPSQFYGTFEEIPYTTATNPPASQYKVFYHIYAGKDFPAYYQVYLRGTGSSFYQDTSLRRPVASGFIKAGDFKSDTIDFTAPSGYKELCIAVNGQEQCGFQKVTTDFGVNYIAEQYVSQQASKTDITTESGCVSGSPDTFSLVNPVSIAQVSSGIFPQSGITSTINPSISSSGIIRICATDNPGKGTDPSAGTQDSRWKQVGYCGSQNMKCWLDTDSVRNVIKNANIENQTLQTVGASYVQALQSQGSYLTNDAFDSLTKEITRLDGNNSQVISRINQDIDSAYYNNQKAYLYLLRGDAFGRLARQGYDIIVAAQNARKAANQPGAPAGPGETTIPLGPGLNVPSSTPNSLGVNYPVFEFQDGTFTSNVHYTYSADNWFWCVSSCSDKNNWYKADLANYSGQSGQEVTSVQIIPRLSDKNKQFIQLLVNQDYSAGLQLLINRTIQNNEGGILPCLLGGCTALVTDNVDLSYDSTFNLKSEGKSVLGTDFEFPPSKNKWQWSPDKQNWMPVPQTRIKGGAFDSQIISLDVANLIRNLDGKGLYDGAIAIFNTNLNEAQAAAGAASSIACTDQQSCQIALGERIIQLAAQIKQSRHILDSNIKNDTGANSFECLALQIAMTESSLQQCKQMQVGNNPLYCDGNISDTLGGDSGQSIGIMQVNLAKHPDAESLVSNLDANVNYGLNLLASAYSVIPAGCNANPSPCTYNCHRQVTGDIVRDTDFVPVSYYGWERALRNYNGWNTQCTKLNSFTNHLQTVGNPNYVEKVKAAKEDFNNNFFPECM